MTYPKLINKDLENNSFEYDGGDLWVREDVSFWDDQEVCWDNDILNFIRETDTIKKFLWKINYTIPYGNQIDGLKPNQEYKVGKDNRFFSKIAEFNSTNLDIISDVLLFDPKLISDFINKLDGLKKIITSEFNKMPIYNDYPFINRGGTIFVNIQITDDVDEENYTLGTLRKISVTIRLYHRLEGMQEHNKNKSIQNRYAERIRSLIEENSNYKVSGTPQWINGEVLDIDYEPSVEDDENNFMVCELSCEFMTMQTFILEE